MRMIPVEFRGRRVTGEEMKKVVKELDDVTRILLSFLQSCEMMPVQSQR